ncbi:polyhydroxybutyrate depolymerase [Glaciecola sp. SC05]|uniref:extracellular catalytic domain type 2 short-chain-length polyhydroxyalkanoate depolymerase n=1 Tax=Glaciecola sp. SC05 TaxID=1987355 RepID=UPI003528BDF0
MSLLQKQSLCMYVFTALISLSSAPSNAQVNVDKLNLDLSKTSVSGLSSGGYMATQFQLSHSETIVGAGIVGAGPYYCALGDIGMALGQCVGKASSAISNTPFIRQYEQYLSDGRVAAISALQDDRVKLIHGTKDTTVNRTAADLLAAQYKLWLPEAQIDYVDSQAFAHHMPTLDAGNPCDISEPPFIGNCGYDGAGEILSFIYKDLNLPETKEALPVQTIDIGDMVNLRGTSINENALIYVPQSCESGDTCSLHISFHGCNQNIDDVGKAYAEQAGYNRWADVNNIVVLYPQVKKSMFMPLNPQGCWDWWGYTDENYANKQGPQIKAIYQVMQALGKGNKQ